MIDVRGATNGQVVLSCIKKQAHQVMGNYFIVFALVPASRFLVEFLLRPRTSLNSRLWCESLSKILTPKKNIFQKRKQ